MTPGITGAANLPALRGHNAALVLDLLRAAGETGASRPELAAGTGLTPQAVSKITARLRAAGLVAEAGHRPSTGGKPRTVWRLVRDARYAVGLHLDRDELTAVLADLLGGPVAVHRAPFDLGAPPERALDAAAGAVRALLAPAAGPGAGPDTGVLGVGVACPGPLEHRAGVLRRVTGFPEWDGYPLRDALAARLGLPVALDKDTNAAALGLALRSGDGGNGDGGNGGGGASFAYLHLGTGLGAGLVLDGTLYRGARTGAGEFGHQVLQLDGPECGCGDRGCVEALCLTAAARGDTAAAARALGVGAANLAGLLDIDRVVLGGRTVLADPEPYRAGVEAVLAARAARTDGRPVPVSVAPDGARLVADGAAHLVLAPLFGRLASDGRPTGGHPFGGE
ncbi:MAG TPA: ROK family transcriptional regulator [Streptomyces sp.]|uniref:ROK family transcriptional regulator n=1 Tax=Streptomyces sp. TaxID=1931 RepID=UPI002D5B0806|nr:ROK family transcriptional regulator [Streptomyces sp.]HZG05002.1 ROK family transcriptional regulator [Streptomyces sp.]